ncbi:MAG: OB-fold nucleic acid binding domain-containing protein [Acidobacteria bacterium]|nr:OB-fold nucleic acid binding domain-containing protein [Acidobacteriota bacterium]MBV9480961.1 OB-fold nucleic acid binding domain-containing protein [Acidobacteriota bacterium]
MQSSRKDFLAVILLLSTISLPSCRRTTKISDIDNDPAKYRNQQVTIAGRVSTSYGALGSGMFKLEDGSGAMWVYSQNFGVPGTGSEVSVTGRIDQGFSFGGRSFATILRESEPRR